MCDSFVALGNSTVDGSVLLAKSADTEINEAEHVVRMPGRDYGEGAMVRIGHLNIPQARRTHEIILGKSFWAWGAELGANEHGVAVGNEAAFSNQKNERDGACCLDLLRLTVERATSAKEGVEVIAHHVETFGQGGNCQMMGNYAFDSGLLVADASEAYVVNCAGRHWAARQVDDVMAISNRYQISDDWDSSSLTMENGAKPNFRAQFADEELERSAGAVARESAAFSRLKARQGAITVADMAAILRHVGDDEENYDVCYPGVPDKVCMHAAPEEDRWWQATGAMVTDSSADGILVWMTGTSCTDLSIFKPLFFGMPTPDVGPAPLGTYTEGALWWQHERLHRRAMADYHMLKPEIRADFDALESQFFADGPGVKKASAAVQAEFAKDCWQRAEQATSAWIERLEKRNYFLQNTAYRAMWDRFNREASFPI
ncbi:MAG: C69 family dipeptidase [Proteobacteria bacterium]|nr:C69 family dipeptidase [Pseudomonadota bacterium]MDA1357527.1 C69 family dipeptidase [Pseudomonadota bacterium]